MLALDNIDTYYGETQALFGVSLAVRAGEILALLGANGAVKTTTLRSILGLTRPRRGRIAFDGRDVTFRDAADLYRTAPVVYVAVTEKGKTYEARGTALLTGGAAPTASPAAAPAARQPESQPAPQRNPSAEGPP